MQVRTIMMAAVMASIWAPALAFDDGAIRSAVKPITAFAVAGQNVEMVAVTRRARADTPLRRAYLEEAQAMAKVMPGFPQPAYVSVDFRLKF